MRHVDEGRLHAWLDGELPEEGPDGARALEAHIESCAVCRARAEEEEQIRDAASAILGGADPGEIAAPRMIPRPVPAAPVSGHPRGRGRWWISIGWAASVLLAVGIGWMARPGSPERVAIDVPPPAPSRTQGPPVPVPGAVQAPAEEIPSPARIPDRTDAAEAPDGAAGRSVLRERSAAPPRAEPAAPSVAADMSVPRPEPMPAPSLSPPPPPPPPGYALGEQPAPVAGAEGVMETAAKRTAASRPDSAALARAVTVRGRVTDTDGRALANAVVRVPSLALATTTAVDGSYALTIPADRIEASDSLRMQASRLGMEGQIRSVLQGRVAGTTVDFALTESALALDALVVTGASGPEEAAQWRAASREEAQRLLGRRLVTVPDLPVTGIELRQVDGRVVVRVWQRLPDGDALSLEQQRASRPAARARGPAEPGKAPGESRVTVRKGGLIVDASAPLPADSLRALLEPLS
jgi:hypothetical protein